jgi:hypothetical protein
VAIKPRRGRGRERREIGDAGHATRAEADGRFFKLAPHARGRLA